MWNNLFISYQLNDPEQNQEAIAKAIDTLGNSTQLHDTCWYVNSPKNASEAGSLLGRVLDEADILIVTNTSSDSAIWHNLNEKQEIRIKQNWKR